MAVTDVLERLRTARQEKALADGTEVLAWMYGRLSCSPDVPAEWE